MVLRFDPPELLDQLKKAHAVLSRHLEHDWEALFRDDFDPAEYDNQVITAASRLECYAASSHHDSFALSVAEYLEWATIIQEAKLVGGCELHSSDVSLFYVSPAHDRTELYIFKGLIKSDTASQVVKLDGEEYRVRLVSGPTPFAVLIDREGDYDEDLCPALDSGDVFVEVCHPEGADVATVRNIADSFLFELSASRSLDFVRSPFREIWREMLDDAERPCSSGEALRIRQPDASAGMCEVYKLFLKGVGATDVEHKIIGFVKVIEFVSATVVRLNAHEAIRMRLLDARSLAPDAKFLDDLILLVDENRVFRKDSEALKLTVAKCCDASQLAQHAPPSVGELRMLREADDSRKKREALDALSECLSATRNALVHAKANYTATGAECPDSELPQLAECARAVAMQAIRWFSTLPADARVVP